MRLAIERMLAAWGHVAYRRPGSVIAVVLALVGALATQLPSLELDASTEGFLHEDDPIRVNYDAFRRQFGRDDMVLIAIEGERVFDFDFLARLRALHQDIENSVPRLEEVTSLVNTRETRGQGDELIVRELLEDWPQTPEELAAIETRAMANTLYRNNLISDDGKVTTLVIETDAYAATDDPAGEALSLEPFAAPTPAKPRPFLTGQENSAIAKALHEVVDRHQAPGFRIHLAGMPIMIDKLTSAMQRDMQRFTALAILVIAVFLFALFRRLAAVVLPLVIVTLSLLTTLALMGISGIPISMPSQILPSFLLAVGVGDTVHVLTIFYQRIRRGDSREDAIAGALGHSGLAILMTSLTTAGGLLSFATAELAPIAEFGMASPIGVLLAFFFTIILLPALIAVTPMRSAPATDRAQPGAAQRAMIGLGAFSSRHAIAVSLASAGIVAISLLGAAQVRFSHDPMSWFPENDDFRRANEFVNERLKGTMFLEVVIDSRQPDGLHDPDRLMKLDEIRRFALGYQKGDVFVGKTVSPADVVKEIHQALNENRPEYYAIPTDRQLVAQELLLFESSGSDDLEKLFDSRFQLGRMTFKLPFLDAIQYSAYMDTLEAKFAEVLGDSADFQFTGLLTLAGRTIHAVVYSMASSYVLAFLVITPMMILLIGDLRLGLLSMIPNLAPVVVTLGLMGWLGIPLDAFTLLIGSIALGLAVDDTIHFLHGFRRSLAATGDIGGAIQETLSTTGQAMLYTSLVLSCAFFVYMFASMRNLFNFGLLTGFTILIALLADAILMPALVTLFARPDLAQTRPQGTAS